jgi:trans-aconitate 2-methyltransferase
MMKSWDAAQYSRFETERNRPIHDLLAQLPREGIARAVDIGCGPGNSTELLQQRYPAASLEGMDSSPEMIAAARKRLPGVRFDVGDIAGWRHTGPAPDLVFGNAVLQWVPDHAKVLPALISQLAPGGYLAIQMPDNLQEPAHLLMREVAQDGPWAGKVGDALKRRDETKGVDWYFRVLRDAGASVDIWRTTYQHQLAGGAAAVVEWFKGSALRPFLQAMNDAEKAEFLSRYEEKVRPAYPIFDDGTVLLPFPRLFFVARRG